MHFRMNKRLNIVFVALGLFACRPDGDKALFDAMVKASQSGNPEAQYHVGMMLNNGIGVRKDSAKAFEWFQNASKAGDPLANYKVGCYLGGQFEGVVPIDHEGSLQHKLVAANAGYALAQMDVGNAYARQGRAEEAVRWWTLAAAQGNPTALYNLSVGYKEGKGAPKDLALAYAHFKLAKLVSEKKVSPNAQAGLDELKREMSAADLSRAEQFVTSWKPNATVLTKKAADGLAAARNLISENDAQNN